LVLPLLLAPQEATRLVFMRYYLIFMVIRELIGIKMGVPLFNGDIVSVIHLLSIALWILDLRVALAP
jgi:hypothetical protein